MTTKLRPGLARTTLLGVAPVVAAGAIALLLADLLRGTSAALWAVLVGFVVGPIVRRSGGAAVGRRVSATSLRAGVALLGAKVSLSEIVDLGGAGLVVAAGTVVTTLVATQWLGRRAGLDRRVAVLVGTGTAICGASAIAAMAQVTDARDEDISYATAVVTLIGTVSMFAIPFVGVRVLGLSHHAAGLWAGASVHEVAQVAAAGALISPAALAIAAIVKLTRVATLAPTVAVVAAARRRAGTDRNARSAPLLPWFVAGFVVLAALRSAEAWSQATAASIGTAATALLAVGLVGCGMSMRPSVIGAAGSLPLAIGFASWAIAACTSLALIVLLS